MEDRNPAMISKICPKCGEKAFRVGITVRIVRQYCSYCKKCGYKTETSISEQFGCKPYLDAKE
jgi:transcription elongation factor Elf1